MKTITKQNIFGEVSWLLLLLLLIANSLQAQPGVNDSTFNIPDNGVNSIVKGADKAIRLSAIQLNNNKIIIAGDFTQYNSTPANRIARLTINGTIDGSFNTGTGLNGIPKALVVQSDFKIIVGGSLSTYNSQPINHIIRLNSNGKIDNTFKIGTGFNGPVTCIALQADGKILVGGNFTAFNGSAVNGIARLNKNGSLDNSFNTIASYTAILKIGIQADGKIIIAYGRTFLERLNQNGTVDASFNYVPFPRSDDRELETMVIQQDGKILIGGGSAPGINAIQGFLYRYTNSGDMDATFEYTDTDRSWIYSLALQADGKIILSGTQGVIPDDRVSRNCVKRLLADGKTDSTFFEVNKVTEILSVTYTVNIQPDGKIIAGGFFQHINTYEANNLIRLNTDGTPDITFNKTTGANGSIRASAIQKNGKIIIGGNFYTYQYKSRNHIARLTKDGKLDNSFDPGTGTNGSVYAVAVQTDGKILIGGDFTSYNGLPANNIARINADGSLDSDFHIGAGVNDVVNTIKIQPDGKILLAGEFLKINGVSCNMLARLNTDGTTDNTFHAPAIQNGHYSTSINDILLLPSNNLLIGGDFVYSVNGKYFGNILKLNTNGVLDTSFARLERYEIVNAFALQPDGKIIIGGGRRETETQYYGVLFRINTDGTMDTTFKRTQTVFKNYPCYVQSISLLAKNNVLVGGRFVDFDNKNANHIMLVNANGSLDPTFVGDANGYVWTTQALKDEKALVAGGFTDYNGLIRNRITRIVVSRACPALKATERITNKELMKTDELIFSVYPNPASSSITIDNIEKSGVLEIRDVSGKLMYTDVNYSGKHIIDVSNYSNGIYFINYITGEQVRRNKLVLSK
jgi:uncharacterized delta-60 repeat protein